MQYHRERAFERRWDDSTKLWLALGAGALLGLAAAVYWQPAQRSDRFVRPADSAPGRAARRRRFGGYAVAGRTVTIARPRSELYAFWRDSSNLASFMENVEAVEATGPDRARWSIAGPAGRTITLETRLVEDREGELIAWRSFETSDIDTEGRVAFRDAPGGRGTEVEAIVAYRPPAGELGRWVATLFQKEPSIQGRRDLKRLKMLMETGEIATSQMRKDAA